MGSKKSIKELCQEMMLSDLNIARKRRSLQMNNSTETKIFIAGHNGMVGSALVRKLSREKNLNIVTADKTELNLLDFNEVLSFFEKHKFCHVYLAAAKVGGINANNIYPADFIFDNLAIQLNVIRAAFLTNVNRLLFPWLIMHLSKTCKTTNK